MAGVLTTQRAVSASDKWLFLSEVKALVFSFLLLLFQALYNNILEGAQSLAEITEQTVFCA